MRANMNSSFYELKDKRIAIFGNIPGVVERVKKFEMRALFLVKPKDVTERWSPDFGQDVKLIPTKGWD
jgi:hypothetical protein